MRLIATTVMFVLLVAIAARANPSDAYVTYFADDMESGENGWTHHDLTTDKVPHFHIDSYLAFDDPAFEDDLSWWCGTFDYDSDGGYGNGWDDRLVLPTIHVDEVSVVEMTWGGVKSLFLEERNSERAAPPRGVLPVLTFQYRHDSEPGFDYTYVEVDSSGTWVTLNGPGWDGASGGWLDLGAEGYLLERFGNELDIRFRFISDGAWSDEDGDYQSAGGAFHVDNITVYDYVGGAVLFYDDCQDGGLCQPAVPPAAGDFWHIVDRKCPAHSDPHSWWCGDDADTSHIPPNLENALVTPMIPAQNAMTCTVRMYLHSEVPITDNDYYAFHATVDGGATWYPVAANWGDFGQCDGWGTSGICGWDIGYHCGVGAFGFDDVAFKIIFHTTDNGCGPGTAGGAGIYIDDFRMEGYARETDVSRHVRAVRPPKPEYHQLFQETRYGRW